jgi:hypothetical protein
VSERTPSRLEAARQRAAAVKRAFAIGSVAAFGVAALWAHGSHPGAAAVQSSGAGSVTLDDDANQGLGFDFGSASLAPSTGAAPDTGTHVS